MTKRTWLAGLTLIGACTTGEDTHLSGADAATDAVTEAGVDAKGENRPPVAGNDSAETFAGVMVEIDVQDNDGDPDGDDIDVTDVTAGAHGTTTIQLGKVRYTPNDAVYIGEDTFTYSIDDDNGGTDEGTVTVTIVEPPTIVILSPADNAVISGTDTMTVTFMVTGCAFQSPSSGGECHAHKFLDGNPHAPPATGIGIYTVAPFDVSQMTVGAHVFRLSLAKNDGTDDLWIPEIYDEVPITVE
jgi:hypothetical protein